MNDPQQLIVIQAHNGEYLTFAPPGCGKTHVLAERILCAQAMGVPYSEILCLTFTNRAARSMKDRIRSRFDDPAAADAVFVGNIHRFCSRFLLDNALVPAETAIIDDDDIISILAQHLGMEEIVIAGSYRLRRKCFDAVHLAAMMHQIERLHPKELRIHPECLSKDDVRSLKHICDVQQLEFTPSVMAKIYRDADDYKDIVKSPAYPTEWQPALAALLDKMIAARYYDNYKRDNRLTDFEDMLLLTYDALAAEAGLTGEKAGPFKHYTWCQVDEVQDLNPLQIRIIDMLMKPVGTPNRTMMFLGDEQQAIFSFMGAKTSTLEQLKRRANEGAISPESKVRANESTSSPDAGSRIFHLATNHRSPSYLLEVFNRYAEQILHIDPSLLPTADFEGERTGNELTVFCSPTLEGEYFDAARQAATLAEGNAAETTAVIVLTNAEADIISRRMDEIGVSHFKVSGADLFATPEVKLLIAHASVFANEHNFIAWSRLLTGLRIYERGASARAFMRSLTDVALTPVDLMLRPNSSYIMEFAAAVEEKEIVVFDTETTGLDTAEDDIVQIAAVKMRHGKVAPGSAFSVHIATNRPIPALLGTIENPIIEERRHQRLVPQREALSRFAEYIGRATLIGHNAAFDYAILDANLKRYLPEFDLAAHAPDCFDTLKISRLLFPQLRQYKLKSLLEEFRLEGENSHLADADVTATCSLVTHCYSRCREIIPLQKEFLRRRSVRAKTDLIRTRLLPLYRATLSRLRVRQTADVEPLLAAELRNLYAYLLKSGFVQPVKNIEYVFRYIAREIVNPDTDRDLHAQIGNHIIEISTLKESDLCTANILDERIIITTVHKAKGLEFDNVLIFDVTDDRWPAFYSAEDSGSAAEDARKLYVALTRSRRRVLLMLSAEKSTRSRRVIRRQPSRFLEPILPLFLPARPDEV